MPAAAIDAASADALPLRHERQLRLPALLPPLKLEIHIAELHAAASCARQNYRFSHQPVIATPGAAATPPGH